MNKTDRSKLIDVLNKGGVAIIPTDTLYGLVARARDEDAVERIYDLKKRRPEKPLIILIGDFADLGLFDIEVAKEDLKILKKVWPGKVTIILPAKNFEYLSRKSDTLAFRLPNDHDLRELITQVGPIVAPSANPEASAPAVSIEAAKKYFSDNVDLYVDGGILQGEPSTIISLQTGKIVLIRQGAEKIS